VRAVPGTWSIATCHVSRICSSSSAWRARRHPQRIRMPVLILPATLAWPTEMRSARPAWRSRASRWPAVPATGGTSLERSRSWPGLRRGGSRHERALAPLGGGAVAARLDVGREQRGAAALPARSGGRGQEGRGRSALRARLRRGLRPPAVGGQAARGGGVTAPPSMSDAEASSSLI